MKENTKSRGNTALPGNIFGYQEPRIGHLDRREKSCKNKQSLTAQMEHSSKMTSGSPLASSKGLSTGGGEDVREWFGKADRTV